MIHLNMGDRWPDLKIEPVFEEELYTTPPMMQVVVAKVVGTRQAIPKAFQLTKDDASVAELKHLRRIRNCTNGDIECVLCKLNLAKEQSIEDKLRDIQELYMEAGIFKDYRIALVPSSAPKTEDQLKACTSIWPCKFAKSNYLIQCIDGTVFDAPERKVLNIIVNSLLDYLRSNSSLNGGPQSAAVVFRYAKIYGLGLSNETLIKQHPIKHSPMLAIDSVARNAGSGHWKSDQGLNVGDSDSLFQSIQERCSSDDLKNHKIEDSFLPYLCTNYDIFVTEEPCMMCTMGLVQSRIRRLFYLSNSEHQSSGQTCGCRGVCYPDGAIENFLVHRDKSLNHRFEAWRIKVMDFG